MSVNNRGNLYGLEGLFDQAAADYSEAIRLEPTQSGFYLNRGIAEFYLGSGTQALTDLDRVSEINPKSAYAALWREIVSQRNKQPSRLTEAATRLDMSQWPAPVVRFYLDQTPRDDALVVPDDQDAGTKKRQSREADFFIGELVWVRGAKDEAVTRFRQAAAECGANSYIGSHAHDELRALGAQP